MPNFSPSHMPFPGLPANFLSQAEARFGGSLEDAVARLQDGSLPAADVESLRNLFASLLTTAGQGADNGGSGRQALFPSAGAGVAETDGASEEMLSLPWSAEELPADLLAALGLPPGGQNLPDALPDSLPDASSHGVPGMDAVTSTGESTALAGVLPWNGDDLPFDASPDAAAVIADDTLSTTLIEGETADVGQRAATPSAAFGAIAAAGSDAPSGMAPTATASAAQAAAAGVAGSDIPEESAGVARAAAGAAVDSTLAGTTETVMAESAADGAHPLRSTLTGNAVAPAAAESPAAVQRLAALLAEMDPVGEPADAASDEGWLRETMQRIDTALQSLRSGGGEAALSRPEQGSPALPAGLEALAARLLAAGDDTGKRLSALQEARQLAAGVEGAAAAAPTAPNPAAVSAAGAERAPPAPALPLGLALQHERWGEEVGERVRWMVGQQMQSAELKITPQHLGTIEVRISMHKDQMQISFVSPHAAVREALEDAAPRLREMMSAAGYATVDVDVSHQEPSRQHDGGSRQWAGVGAAPWGGEDSEVHESVGTIAPRAKGSLDCYA